MARMHSCPLYCLELRDVAFTVFQSFQFTQLLNHCHLTSFVNQRSQIVPQEIEKVCCKWNVSLVEKPNYLRCDVHFNLMSGVSVFFGDRLIGSGQVGTE